MRSVRVVCVAVIVASCSGVSPQPTAGPTEMPVAGGRLIEGWNSDPPTLLQPLLQISPGQVGGLIYEPLLGVDPRDRERAVPGMATMSTSRDGRTYTLEIRDSATWSDGRPVLADDWLTSNKLRLRSKKSPWRTPDEYVVGATDYATGKAQAIAGIQADGKRLVVTTRAAFCITPQLLFFQLPPMPSHVFGKYIDDADATRNFDDAPENTHPPVSSGPFKLKEWRRGDQVTFVRNERYWRGAPLLDEYVYKVIDPGTGPEQMRSGAINFRPQVTREEALAFERDVGVRVHRIRGRSQTYIGWNTRSATAPFLRERQVRQALAHALDWGSAIQRIVNGEAERALAYHPPWFWAAPAGLNDHHYDPSTAEKLLRAAGFVRGTDGIYERSGVRLRFTVLAEEQSAEHRALLQLAIDNYRAIGADVNGRLVTGREIQAMFRSAERPAEAWVLSSRGISAAFEWHSRYDPVTDAANLASGHGSQDPELDRAVSGTFDPADADCSEEALRRSYERTERILNGQQPWNFGYATYRYWIVPAGLRRYEPNPFNSFDQIHKWWIAPEKK